MFRFALLALAWIVLTGLHNGPAGVGGCGRLARLPEAFSKAKAHDAQVRERLARAQKGDAQAQHAVGRWLMFEIRHDLKYEEGRQWLCRSAKQGYAPAQYDLGSFYSGDLDHRLVTVTVDFPRDVAQAYKWLTLAARQGDAAGIARLELLSSTMSAADRQRGERLLLDWRNGPCGPAMIVG